MDVVTELLARIGEFVVLAHTASFGMIDEIGDRFYHYYLKETPGTIIAVDFKNEPRRLILDQDFGWMWYNAEEGPVE